MTAGIPETLVTTRQNPLAAMGVSLQEGFTAEEAMTHGMLGNWNVRLEEMQTPGGLVVPKRRAVVRDNPHTGEAEVMGDVGENYHIIQNEEHAEFLNALVDESGAVFETAGTMRGGEIVFMSMRLPGHMLIGGSDKIDTNIVAVNGHSGNRAFSLMATPIRFECANVMNLAWSRASHTFKIQHRKGAAKGFVQQAREALDLTFSYLDTFQEEAERLIQTAMTQAQFEEIVEREFGAPEDAHAGTVTRAENKIAEMVRLFADSPTNAGIRDTAWAGVNALTEWFDHYSPVKGNDRGENALLHPGIKNEFLSLIRANV